MRIKTIYDLSLALGILPMSFAFPANGQTQADNTRLVTFQRFVNGEEPIKEAVVYRKLTGTNGTLWNQEWFRFGLQSGTWYVQRLLPKDTNDPAVLVPRDPIVHGASYSNFWVVNSKDIGIAEKSVVTNSLLDKESPYRNMMFNVLSLGIPRNFDTLNIEDAPIKWEGQLFESTVAIQRDKNGNPKKFGILTGKLTLDTSDRPISVEYQGVENFPGGSVAYAYQTETSNIPAIITAKYADEISRVEFVLLDLGSNDLSQTGGYVPSQFADTNVQRLVTIWTNGKPYSLINGKAVPAFETHPEVKRNRKIIIVVLVAISIAFLVLLFFQLKQTKMKK